MNYSVFLRWMLLASIFCIGVFTCFQLGLIQEMYAKDTTMLSSVILIAFFVMTTWCGTKTFIINKCENDLQNNTGDLSLIKKEITSLEPKQEFGWFMSEMFLGIGMVGTIIGFIMMLSGFGSIDPDNVNGMKDVLFAISSGMATALITTLVGLICSLFLKFQYVNLTSAIDRVKNKIEKK